jgi:glutamine synthetase
MESLELLIYFDAFGFLCHDNKICIVLAIESLDDINKYVEAVRVKATAMREARKAANMIEDIYERALAYHDIAESLYDLRKPIDKLEELVDNRMWPLPKYRELLFIS